MAGKRQAYTPEFKLQAVKRITDQKLSVAEVARRLASAKICSIPGRRTSSKKVTTHFRGRDTSRHSKKKTANSKPRSNAWRWSGTS